MLKVFAVFDVKAASFGTPIFLPSVGLAVRMFDDAVMDPKSNLGKHASDYSLYELGTYDANTGALVSLVQPAVIMSASDVVSKRVADRLKVEPELPLEVTP